MTLAYTPGKNGNVYVKRVSERFERRTAAVTSDATETPNSRHASPPVQSTPVADVINGAAPNAADLNFNTNSSNANDVNQNDDVVVTSNNHCLKVDASGDAVTSNGADSIRYDDVTDSLVQSPDTSTTLTQQTPADASCQNSHLLTSSSRVVTSSPSSLASAGDASSAVIVNGVSGDSPKDVTSSRGVTSLASASCDSLDSCVITKVRIPPQLLRQ